MALYSFGLALFFIPHFFSAMRSRAEGKDIRKSIGEAKYMGLYSAVTLLGFFAMIIGFARAPNGETLFAAPHSLHHISWVFMMPALILLASAYMPLGHIKRAVQHPMMLAVLIWAGFHLAVGGDLKRVLMFGLFFAYAFVSLICAYKRGTSLKDKPAKPIGDILAIILGLVITGVFMHGGHLILFGVPPV